MEIDSIFISIDEHSKANSMPYLVVGGNAVNLHKYHRNTFDIDIMIPEDDYETWKSFFESKHGYQMGFKTQSFARLNPPAGQLPLDLMLASASTFAKLYDQRITTGINKHALPAPKAHHLIAMKLHALRNNPQRDERKSDFLDITHLLDLYEIDKSDSELQDMINNYADEHTKKRIVDYLENR